MSDTPRTSALRAKIDEDWAGYDGPDTSDSDEALDLAEELERELNEAKASSVRMVASVLSLMLVCWFVERK